MIDPLIGVRTRLFPHFRTGDFAFDLRTQPARIQRYVHSLALAFEDRRLPFARGLLISLSEDTWWKQMTGAHRASWSTGWLDHEGVHDASALRRFEDGLRASLRKSAIFIALPNEARGRAAFRTMKSIADVGYSIAAGATHHAWWLYL